MDTYSYVLVEGYRLCADEYLRNGAIWNSFMMKNSVEAKKWDVRRIINK